MYDALLIDGDPIQAARITQQLDRRGLRARVIPDPQQAAAALRSSTAPYRLVIVNVSKREQTWLEILEDLQAAVYATNRFRSPRFLCVSMRRHDPHFELEVERRGARCVFVR
jgi:PleD family two-component response regulator